MKHRTACFLLATALASAQPGPGGRFTALNVPVKQRIELA
jgi:hypothetical protein